MIQFFRTNSDNTAFQALVGDLDADLSIRDGDAHSFYAQFNSIVKIKYVVLAYDGETPVGCGAIKEYDGQRMEVKRMFVVPLKRQQGIASAILKELELWAVELHHPACLLETGKNQPEAIKMYLKNGYSRIPNFGQYEHVANSVCFERKLSTENPA